MGIKQRCFLVALLVACQAACLGFGAIWATGWLWKAFTQVVHSQVLSEGKALVYDLSTDAKSMGLGSVEPGSADWHRLQALCEETAVPYDGFVCVMRRDNGAMLCHPNLAEDPGLLRLFPGHRLLVGDQLSIPVTTTIGVAEEQGQHVVSGQVDFDGEHYVLSGLALPEQNAILAVYQSREAISQYVQSTIHPIVQVGYVLAVFVVGATVIITNFLIDRHEAGIAEAGEKIKSEVDEQTQALVQSRNAMIFGLAKLSESRDRDTSMHLERLRQYVTLLATELARVHRKIDHHFVANLATASSLHDVGKVGIPDAVLLKPGKLTPSERKAMEMHTLLGSESLVTILQQVGSDDLVEMAQQIALAHHEHWDGGGYPHCLQGRNIPLAARIVALADVYDALTSVRPHKERYEHKQAREWIVSRYGTQFDPDVVEAFVACEQEFIRINQNCRRGKRQATIAEKTAEVTTEAVDASELSPS